MSARRRTARSGFTMLELMVSLAIFGVIGYGLAISVDMGRHSQGVVLDLVARDRALRAATSGLIEELALTGDAHLQVVTLSDGNHQLSFQSPIDVAGAATWGVHELELGSDASAQNRAGWWTRYTARTLAGGEKELVRQIVDNAGAVQRERVLVRGLRGGSTAPAGFQVVKQGNVWQVTLSTADSAAEQGLQEVFHVHTRN